MGCTHDVGALPTRGAGGGVLAVRGGRGFFAAGGRGGVLFVDAAGRGGSGVFGATATGAGFAGRGGGGLETTLDFFAAGRGTAVMPPRTQRTRQHGMRENRR